MKHVELKLADGHWTSGERVKDNVGRSVFYIKLATDGKKRHSFKAAIFLPRDAVLREKGKDAP